MRELQAGRRGAYVGPRSALEELLAGIMAGVLKRELVGVHHDFFAIGGHSLKATQVVSQLRQALLTDVPVRSFFETPTVAELAVSVVRALAEQADAQTVEEALSEAERGV